MSTLLLLTPTPTMPSARPAPTEPSPRKPGPKDGEEGEGDVWDTTSKKGGSDSTKPVVVEKTLLMRGHVVLTGY